MTQEFGLGSDQPLVAADERSLLDSIEAVIDFCLVTPNAFALVDYQGGFCQLFLDQAASMHIGSSYGPLLVRPGLDESRSEVEAPASNVLPSTWHGRSRIAAEAMTRAFIDTGKMAFPAELSVEIISIGKP